MNLTHVEFIQFGKKAVFYFNAPARVDFRNLYSDWRTSMEYETPNYKVWVGNFATRLEADRAWVKIKKEYMNAIIFQPKLEEEKN